MGILQKVIDIYHPSDPILYIKFEYRYGDGYHEN
jgi:hypothetical protein